MQKIAGLKSTELAEALKRLSFANQTKTYLFWPKTTSRNSNSDNPQKNQLKTEQVAMDHGSSTPRLRIDDSSPTLLPAPP